jgi:WD40 repeat protein
MELGALEAQSTTIGNDVSALSISRDGAALATGAFNGVVCLWNAQNLHAPFVQWQAHTAKVTAQAFACSGSQLLTAGADQQLCTWKLDNTCSPQLVGQFKLTGLATALAVANDGRTLAVASGERLEIFELAGTRLELRSELHVQRNQRAARPTQSCAGAGVLSLRERTRRWRRR